MNWRGFWMSMLIALLIIIAIILFAAFSGPRWYA